MKHKNLKSVPMSTFIEWDVPNWSRVLRYWDKTMHYDYEGKRILELGARHGGITLYLTLQGAEVVCTDINPTSDKAINLHKEYGVDSQVTYKQEDATNISFEDESFDVVLFKSMLGGVVLDNDGNVMEESKGMDKQRQVLNEIYRVLKPGGMLIFAENLAGSPLHMFLRKKFRPWGGSWQYITIDKLKTITGSFKEFGYKTFGFWGLLTGNIFLKKIAHVCDLIISPILPESYKYIIFGYAKK